MSRLNEELDALRSLIDRGGLASGRGLVGIEIEFHLVDDTGRPALRNAEVLAALADGPHDLQTELARFNLELNLPPVPLTGHPLTSISRAIDDARTHIAQADPPTRPLGIGILPTLTQADVGTAAISGKDRYHELDASILALRGEPIDVSIEGVPLGDGGADHLTLTLETITLEAAATSLQIHLDLPADGFVDAWNTAQAIAAIQVAVGANAPLLLGRALWHETRIPLFEQVIDVRRPAGRDVQPPRVWFGERWIDHAADLFVENVRYFGTLLADDPRGTGAVVLEPSFDALRRHNGTVWRWNRPVYAVVAGRPTLRLENRVLSTPPTSSDGSADIALFLGLVAGLRDHMRTLRQHLAFDVAARNFRTAARHGITAMLDWPGTGDVETALAPGTAAQPSRVTDLLGGGLLDLAMTGLKDLGVPTDESGPALAIIAERAATGRTGAAWQLAAFAEERERGDRAAALRRVVLRYQELQEEGAPVHLWPWPGSTRRRSARSGESVADASGASDR